MYRIDKKIEYMHGCMYVLMFQFRKKKKRKTHSPFH